MTAFRVGHVVRERNQLHVMATSANGVAKRRERGLVPEIQTPVVAEREDSQRRAFRVQIAFG
jgi:hypothetical protein